MNDIYVYGCGGVGRELAANLIVSEEFNLAGFIVDDTELDSCMGVKITTIEELVKTRRSEDYSVVISCGEPVYRRELSERLKRNGINEACVVLSSRFNPCYSSVGPGTIIHEDAYISVDSKVGKGCLINKGALVGHDCTVGDYSVLSPRCTLGGFVSVGENTFIGSGANIRDRVSIGSNSIIGIGSVVVDDVEDNSVVAGNPARFIRKNDKGLVFEKKH
ncbi:MAG: acetyltransferase [Lachnospiraceae bacterium]|nr:acetyltransferase [Lachnospiraceae bacterium]